MTSISSLQSIVNGTSSTTAASQDAVVEAEDRFLKLLIAQMRNQDPLNPLDNAEVTSQMAQLSTVSGINKLNASLEALQTSFLSSQSLQMASMIGRGVFVPGSSVTLYSNTAEDGTTSLQGVLGANLSSAADKVVVTVRDSSGAAVYTKDLGAQSEGILNYLWDGKTTTGGTAAAGKYTFEIAATKGGEKVAATSLSFGEVLSVTNGASGAELNVQNIGAVSTADVVQVY